jgi:D-glucosaminate-6-phosphate ammonia-lyase
VSDPLAGAKRVVNAMGIYTELGGSIPSPGVRWAMEEASNWWISIPELLETTGREIAALVGSEAARVVPGAAAGIALGTAACLTRGDRALVERLPDTDRHVVIQRGHRYKYERCVRMAGARIVEADPDRLEEELVGAAALFFPGHLDREDGTVPLDRACALAHEAGVPVLVDAAYLVDPPARMREIVEAGPDLVCVSAKYFGGPNAGGFVAGSRELVDAVAAADFIRFESGEEFRFGRPFKLDRQAIVAVLQALREWFDADHEVRFASYRRKVDALSRRLDGIPDLVVNPMVFTMEETLEGRGNYNCLHIRVGRERAEAADRALREGDPSVRVHVVEDALVVVVETIPDHHEDLLGEALVRALS